MKQVLHILKKDIRRHRWEIALSLAMLALYVWHEPNQWLLEGFEPGLRRFMNIAANVGVVLGWWILLVRVIQGESLVGDRQFWTTRPYEWKKLLAAKVLFVAVFISFPMLLAGMVLLGASKVGMPLASAPSIFWEQLPSETLMMLPVAALAVVTPNFGQFVLAALGVGAYIGGIAAVASYVPSESFSTGSDSFQEWTLVVGCVAAIVWQYTRRRTGHTRMLLAGTALAIFLTVMATPYRTLVAHDYPAAAAGALPVRFAFDPTKPEDGDLASSTEDEVKVQIPIIVSGIPSGSTVSVDGAMMSVEAPGDRHWSSGWNSVGSRLFPDDTKLKLDFSLKRRFLESVKSTPVSARISLALTIFHQGISRRVFIKPGEFAVPGIGLCAFATPALSATISSSEMTCTTAKAGLVPSGAITRDWEGVNNNDVFISPVSTLNLRFWNWAGDSHPDAHPFICPGTPVTITEEVPAQNASVEVLITGVKLDEYRLANEFRFSFGH